MAKDYDPTLKTHNDSAEEGDDTERQAPDFLRDLHGKRAEYSSRLQELLADTSEGQSADREIFVMMELARNLSYEEYRVLDGVLQDMRQGVPGAVVRLSQLRGPKVQELASALLRSVDQRNPQETGKFAADAIMLLRMGYPYGKNVMNPSADPERESSFSAAMPMDIQLSSRVQVRITPYADERGQCSLVRVEGADHVLRDGESIVVGRPLEKDTFFDKKLSKPIALEVRGAVPINNDSVSRAAILLERRGDRLFVFDRGSLGAIRVSQQQLQVKYDPTIRTERGYGESMY